MKTSLRRICLLLTILIACSLSVSAQVAPERPLITVTGQAEVKVAPDEVVFNLEVETLNKELAAAKTINDESVRRVLALARKYEIPARNRTSGVRGSGTGIKEKASSPSILLPQEPP